MPFALLYVCCPAWVTCYVGVLPLLSFAWLDCSLFMLSFGLCRSLPFSIASWPDPASGGVTLGMLVSAMPKGLTTLRLVCAQCVCSGTPAALPGPLNCSARDQSVSIVHAYAGTLSTFTLRRLHNGYVYLSMVLLCGCLLGDADHCLFDCPTRSVKGSRLACPCTSGSASWD